MERDAPGAERKWSVRQGVVPGARDGRAYLVLPAPEAPAGSLHSAGTGTAIAVGRGSAGSKTERLPCQAVVRLLTTCYIENMSYIHRFLV